MRALRPVAALAGLALVACATNPVPRNRRRTQEEAITSGKGAYVLATLGQGGAITGELIASEKDKLVILTDADRLGTVDYDQVTKLALGVHENNLHAAVAWTVLGTLSTVSHGYFLIFSAPIWLVTGIISASNESHRGLYSCERPPTTGTFEDCLRLASVFARFPQGLPPGVREAQVLGRAPVRPRPAASAIPVADAGPPDAGAPSPDAFPAPYAPLR